MLRTTCILAFLASLPNSILKKSVIKTVLRSKANLILTKLGHINLLKNHLAPDGPCKARKQTTDNIVVIINELLC